MRTFIGNFLGRSSTTTCTSNPEVAEAIQKRILRRARAQGARAASRSWPASAPSKAKRAQQEAARLPRPLHDTKHKRRRRAARSSSPRATAPAASITKSRDVETQAVFTLRGKPLNSFGLTRKVVYENEEFTLLQAALGHRGRHRRPALQQGGDRHRCRRGRHAHPPAAADLLPAVLPGADPRTGTSSSCRRRSSGCATRRRRSTATATRSADGASPKLGKNAEITRFKGLGEISPDEFKHFMIGPDMRLDPVMIEEGKGVEGAARLLHGQEHPGPAGVHHQ